MSTAPILPRTLVPLPGEGLAGFLLRLGHRLDRSPARIMQLTGVTGKHRPWTSTPARFLVNLPPAGQASLTRVARLADTEGAMLTLGHLAAHYPPVAESLALHSPAGRIDNWIYSQFTRYCPKCLAGDSSPIQQRHGGPWKIQWRLPIAFCCPDHQILLADRCPDCRLPVHASSPGSLHRLLPSPSRPGLHPAQCRNPTLRGDPGTGDFNHVCGARLDTLPHTPEAHATATTDEIALQVRLHTLLDPRHDALDAAHFFADLRILAAVISATWPRAQPLARDADHAGALDDHLQQMRKDFTERGVKITSNTTYDKPPTSAAATATLLQIAADLLSLSSTDLRDALRSLLERGPQLLDPAWGRTWRRLATTGSPRLRTHLEPTVITRYTTRTLAGGPTAPTRHGGYSPEHVPQRLPEDWYMPLLSGPFNHHVKRHQVLRRTAAVRLVQLPTGLTMAGAARYLGIPDNWLRFTLATHKGGGPQLAKDPFAFDDAVEAIANLLDNLESPVNYHRRRAQLKGWTLSQADWDDIRHQLAPPTVGQQRKLDPYKRQSASDFIWTTVTGSERSLAPLLPDAPDDPEARQIWRNRTAPLHHQVVHATSRYYTALRGQLNEYATDLARQTDQFSETR